MSVDNFDKDILKFLGKEIFYDEHGQMIFARDEKNGDQHILDLRGWGAIQYLYKTDSGDLDFDKAAKFQDQLGHWIANTINEKLQKSKRKVNIGTIGHVDHGKTTLTAAIAEVIANSKDKSVVIVDSLPEEKERGMNIKQIPIEQLKVTDFGPIKSGQENRRERRKKNQKPWR
jgi:hypothetical protein